MKVLAEIKADKIPSIVVLNKYDRVQGNILLESQLNNSFPGALHVSAKTHEGFEDIIAVLTENLLGVLRSFRIPMTRTDLVELARKNGTIEKEEWLEDCIELEARIPGKLDEEGKSTTRTLALLKDYIK